jgi:hypothetical protein
MAAVSVRGDYGGASGSVQAPPDKLSSTERRAEVAELEDALDSKSSGATPRAGSIPAFGIPTLSALALVTEKTFNRSRS